MAEQGSASETSSKTSRRDIPWVTVLVVTTVLLFTMYPNYIVSGNVFPVAVLLVTFVTMWAWTMILSLQITFRHRLLSEEVKALKFRVPGGVATTIDGLILLSLIAGLIGYHLDTRTPLRVGLVWTVVPSIGWMLRHRHDRQLAENQ